MADAEREAAEEEPTDNGDYGLIQHDAGPEERLPSP
jgi:hypothetical protein